MRINLWPIKKESKFRQLVGILDLRKFVVAGNPQQQQQQQQNRCSKIKVTLNLDGRTFYLVRYYQQIVVTIFN